MHSKYVKRQIIIVVINNTKIKKRNHDEKFEKKIQVRSYLSIYIYI